MLTAQIAEYLDRRRHAGCERRAEASPRAARVLLGAATAARYARRDPGRSDHRLTDITIAMPLYGVWASRRGPIRAALSTLATVSGLEQRGAAGFDSGVACARQSV